MGCIKVEVSVWRSYREKCTMLLIQNKYDQGTVCYNTFVFTKIA